MVPASSRDLGRLATAGVGLVYAEAVTRLYEGLTGEPGRGRPTHLVDRLVKEERLTPEAALYLQVFGRAIRELSRSRS